ncbi:MAG: NAD(P)H-quinone oxidoreductase [Alphaproteobacteria bacterium]|nr:NAD(P)H-quinone oxidoreductase [Alphaproteobacteria bacterium]
MRAVEVWETGGPEVLRVRDVPRPVPGPEEVLVRVRAAGVNRADAMIRDGSYPLAVSNTRILGLEIAGDVVGRGERATEVAVGDRVFGLVPGGAYAEYATLDHGMAVPVPPAWSYVDAASVVEVFCTAEETMLGLGRLQAGETVLIHAGGSGVGTAAIQMARHVGARVLFTAGSEDKIRRSLALGGDVGINYRTRDFAEAVREATGGEGVDVVEDFIGGSAFARHLALLKPRGRLVMVGTLGGSVTEFDLRVMFPKRLQILGFSLRNQSIAEKRAITRRFRERWLPLLVEGRTRHILDRTFPLAEAAAAHAVIDRNENYGKVILTVD